MGYNVKIEPFKPGMRIKTDDSVFVFVDGVSVETFEKDEDFRSGMVSRVVAGKVRIEWDETVSVMRGGMSVLVPKYEYVACDRFTRVNPNTWVLDYKSGSPDLSDTAGADEKSDLTQ